MNSKNERLFNKHDLLLGTVVYCRRKHDIEYGCRFVDFIRDKKRFWEGEFYSSQWVEKYDVDRYFSKVFTGLDYGFSRTMLSLNKKQNKWWKNSFVELDSGNFVYIKIGEKYRKISELKNLTIFCLLIEKSHYVRCIPHVCMKGIINEYERKFGATKPQHVSKKYKGRYFRLGPFDRIVRERSPHKSVSKPKRSET